MLAIIYKRVYTKANHQAEIHPGPRNGFLKFYYTVGRNVKIRQDSCLKIDVSFFFPKHSHGMLSASLVKCDPGRRITLIHYDDVIMGAIASQITCLTIVYSTVYSGADQRKHQSSASLAYVRGINWGPVNSPHKWPVTRKMFPFDDVIMNLFYFNMIAVESHTSLSYRAPERICSLIITDS